MLCRFVAGALAIFLLAASANAQDTTTSGANTGTSSRAVDNDDEGFDMGWLGLLGLAGLTGLMGRDKHNHNDRNVGVGHTTTR